MYPNKKLPILLSACLICLASTGNFLFAEGTRQVAPLSSDIAMLLTARPNFSNFAALNGPVDSRLNISIKKAGEAIYLGLTGEYNDDGFPYSQISGRSAYNFQIKWDNPDPMQSDPVVHGPFTIDASNANVSGWNNAVFGAYSTALMLPNPAKGGMSDFVYKFSPTQAGDYYIEFWEVDNPLIEDVYVQIGFWDIAVVESGEELLGRVWSKNWAFRTPPVNKQTPGECDWDRKFHGKVYSYTTDGFVSEIDFSDSGFQGLAFTIAFNKKGPGNSGDRAADRKSVEAVNATGQAAEHKIFLNEPDAELFPNGVCGEVLAPAGFSCNPQGVFCLDVTVTRPGQVEVILDFNQNGKFDANSEDVILVYEFENGGKPLTACIPWNGIKGNGEPIEFGDKVDLIYLYTQGVQHWSVYDGEFMKKGFCVRAVRPLCGDESITNILYWDDRDIVGESGTGQPKDGRAGCACRSNGCRTWTNFDPNQPCGFLDDDLTIGYGDKSTLNTWWFASVTRLFAKDVPLLTCEVTGDNEICAGTTTEFTAAVSAGASDLSYSWSGPGGFKKTGQTTGPIETAGEYCVTITDQAGCSTTCCMTLVVKPAPGLQCTATNVSCKGANDGSINAVASGGQSPYTYSLDGGPFQNSGLFTGLAPGNYTIKVRDAAGCESTCERSITEPPVLACSLLVTDVKCFNGSDGQLVVQGSGGTSPYSYSINGINFGSGNVFSGLSAGSYTVTIKDSKGCISTCQATIGQPALLSCQTLVTDVSCNGGSDGQITVIAAGGTPPYTYSRNGVNYGPSNVFSGLSAGNYTLRVKDSNGCISTCQASVTQPPALSCQIGKVDVDCYGAKTGQITVYGNGGTPPYTYSLNGGSFLQGNVFSGLAAGAYTVTIKDSKGCTSTCSTTLTQPAPLSCLASGRDVTCSGQNDGQINVSASGGTGPYTYSLNGVNFQSSSVFNNVAPGNYTVWTKDNKGCLTTCNVTISKPIPPVCQLVTKDPTCWNAQDGQITVIGSSGTPPYSYSLNGQAFQPGNVFSGLAPGQYTVTIKDRNGCTSTCTATLKQSTPISCELCVKKDVSCYGGSDGAIIAYAEGGIPPYMYSLNGQPFTNNNTFSGLKAGVYVVTIKDKTGCQAQCTITVKEPQPLACRLTTKDCTCGNNGQITVIAAGGTAPYSYSLNNGPYQASATFSNLAPGTYSVKVKDRNGCISSCGTIVIDPGTNLSCSTVAKDVSCYGGADGKITVTASGGTPPYWYAINGGYVRSVGEFTKLKPGKYSITVVDKTGCISECMAEIKEPAPMTCKPWVSEPPCADSEGGTISVMVTGGTGPYMYSINDGRTFQSSSIFTNVRIGLYYIVVKDSRGCTSSCETVMFGPPTPLCCETWTKKNVTCPGGSDGTIMASATGGRAPYKYSIDGVTFQDNNVFMGLPAGTYPVTIKDANGCTATCKTKITEPVAPVCNVTVTNASCGGSGNDGKITVSAQPTTSKSVYVYKLNNGLFQNSPVFSNLGPGQYTVSIKDVSTGCVTSCGMVTVGRSTGLTCAIAASTPACYGGQNGSLTILAGSGNGNYQYSLNNGPFQSSNKFENLAPGMYTIRVKDGNNCQGTCSGAIVSEQPQIVLSMTNTGVTCKGDKNGRLKVSATGGSGPYTYLWNTGDKTPEIDSLAPGDYRVTVTDSKGCSSIGTAKILDGPVCTVAFCTFTADYWANNNTGGDLKKWPNVREALGQLTSRRIKIGQWSIGAACIDVILPGPPYYDKDYNLEIYCNDQWYEGIKVKDVNALMQQAIALNLNMLVNPGMGQVKLGDIACAGQLPGGTVNPAWTIQQLLSTVNAVLPAPEELYPNYLKAMIVVNECYRDRCTPPRPASTSGWDWGANLAGSEWERSEAETVKQLQVFVQPNPATDHLMVSIESPQAGPADIQILDLWSRPVRQVNRQDLTSGRNTFNLDLSTLPAGTYLLMVKDGDGVQFLKFVKLD